MIQSKNITEYLKKNNMDGSFLGSLDVMFSEFRSFSDLSDGAISWKRNLKQDDIDNISKKIQVLILTDESTVENRPENVNILVCKNVRDTYFSVLDEFMTTKNKPDFSDKSVILTNEIGENFKVGVGSFISDEVVIGNNVTIENSVSLVGKVTIGDNVIIGNGSSIGREGFGYYTTFDGENKKIPHIGGVVIKDNVEIASNAVIDRGTLGDTVIGKNSRINNFSHVGHNVVIGDDVFVGVGSILTGSSELKDRVYLAPGSIVRNKVIVSEDSFVGLGAVVVKDVEEKVTVAGIPAKVIKRR